MVKERKREKRYKYGKEVTKKGRKGGRRKEEEEKEGKGKRKKETERKMLCYCKENQKGWGCRCWR